MTEESRVRELTEQERAFIKALLDEKTNEIEDPSQFRKEVADGTYEEYEVERAFERHNNVQEKADEVVERAENLIRDLQLLWRAGYLETQSVDTGRDMSPKEIGEELGRIANLLGLPSHSESHEDKDRTAREEALHGFVLCMSDRHPMYPKEIYEVLEEVTETFRDSMERTMEYNQEDDDNNELDFERFHNIDSILRSLEFVEPYLTDEGEVPYELKRDVSKELLRTYSDLDPQNITPIEPPFSYSHQTERPPVLNPGGVAITEDRVAEVVEENQLLKRITIRKCLYRDAEILRTVESDGFDALDLIDAVPEDGDSSGNITDEVYDGERKEALSDVVNMGLYLSSREDRKFSENNDMLSSRVLTISETGELHKYEMVPTAYGALIKKNSERMGRPNHLPHFYDMPGDIIPEVIEELGI